MKYRHGFVSNSSSSSFVLAAKDSENISIKIEVNLAEMGIVDRVVHTQAALDAHIAEKYGWQQTLDAVLRDYPYVKELYEKASKTIAEGKKVVFCEVSNEDGNAVSAFLHRNGPDAIEFKEGVIVLSRTE